jgi:hypothetical protein
MRLSRISIKNFRNFRSLDVRLGEHAVVLGENKVGKTNILFALRLILDPSPPQMPESATMYRPTTSALGLREDPVACDRFVRLACMSVLSAHRIISARDNFFEPAECRDVVIPPRESLGKHYLYFSGS